MSVTKKLFFVAVVIFSITIMVFMSGCGDDKEFSTARSLKNNNDARKNSQEMSQGVFPTKVTLHGSYTVDLPSFELYFECWNVGKLGGEQYAKATMRQVLIAQDANVTGWKKGDTWTYESTFSGGPNGNFIMSRTPEAGTNKYNFKLNDGKYIVTDSGKSIPLDNSDAFEGWID
jgi:hypothetical protein